MMCVFQIVDVIAVSWKIVWSSSMLNFSSCDQVFLKYMLSIFTTSSNKCILKTYLMENSLKLFGAFKCLCILSLIKIQNFTQDNELPSIKWQITEIKKVANIKIRSRSPMHGEERTSCGDLKQD
jgi:hypothetical protein